MFTRIPAAASVMTIDVPPYETNGSGIPVTGRRPSTAPMLITASVAIQATRPAASSIPNRSGASSAALKPFSASAPNRSITAKAPMIPSSSPITEKMKSVWALGRLPHFS